MSSATLVVPFEELGGADLVVGAVYRGGTAGSAADDPLDKLLHCGNMGGFRIRGGPSRGGYQLVVLYTTFADSDWPDELDDCRCRFVYYGDNKCPGRGLHETPKGGNELLRRVFEAIHVEPPRRECVPPFFVFSRVSRGRDVRFHGLAVPGASDLCEADDLVACWKTRGGVRFQNYRAVFTLLNVERVPRPWIESLVEGNEPTSGAPEPWRRWVATGC